MVEDREKTPVQEVWVLERLERLCKGPDGLGPKLWEV